MTLDTRVYIHDPIDIRQVFVKCCQLLGCHEGIRCREHDGGMMTEPGQDLPAWLTVHPSYDDDGVTAVSFDTAYGYRDEQGRGCSELHADLVRQLGAWLDGRGVRWSWLNEFTGDIHPGGFGLNTLLDPRARPVADR